MGQSKTELTASSGMDRRRFERLWARSAQPGNGAPERFAEIERHYCEPHRRYHTPEHVEHCLTQLDAARGEMTDPDAVELAVWYHDVIYDVRRDDNEALSAELFARHAEKVMSAETIRRVRALIMVTVHNRVTPKNGDEGVMVDIDLSSFALPWDAFLRDSVAVREEFPHLPDDVFYARQQTFLETLLAREFFFFSDFFRRRHEHRARENIVRYLELLRGKGFMV